MKFDFLRILAALLAIMSSAAAEERGVNIMGGPDDSTSMAFAEVLAGVSRSCGYSTKTHFTEGALDNLLSVRRNRYTQFGFVQADVLEYLRAYETVDPQIEIAVKGMKVAFPLFEKEVHIVAAKDVAELTDLEGKRVSIGAENSGDFLTATVMFDLLGYGPSKRVTLPPIEALDALKAGRIDAMLFVDGAPSALLSKANLDPEKFHLIDITDPILEIAYVGGQIDAGTYSFVEKDTKVVTVTSVVMTYDYVPKGRNAYNTLNCQYISDVTHLTKKRLDRFRDQGHPKWSEVDLGTKIPDWELSVCAARGLAGSYVPKCR